MKHQKKTSVSVVLPALNEEKTIEPIVRMCMAARSNGLVDEVVVIDSGSVDETVQRADRLGATVFAVRDLLPELGHRPGKAECLWKGLAVTSGDLVAYMDTDIENIGQHYLPALLGPLVDSDSIKLVKAFYDRPLGGTANNGGRVTEILARPLISYLLPELAHIIQPMSGEFASRRSTLSAIPFAAGYAVDIGIVIDIAREFGPRSIAQMDLGTRDHRHHNTQTLGRMGATVLAAVLRRATVPAPPADFNLVQYYRNGAEMTEIITAIDTQERPPLSSIKGRFAPRPSG